MDAPRIVIGLADNIAGELARDGSHDKKSLQEIATAFAGEKRLSRLRALLSEREYQSVQATRLVDEFPNHDCRAQARLEEDIRKESNLFVPTLLGLFCLDLPGFDDKKAHALLDRLRELIQSDPETKQPAELETAYFYEKVGLAHGTALGQQRRVPQGGGFYDQPYLTYAGINLPVMSSGADAARWKRYNGTDVQFIQIEAGWDVSHKAFDPDRVHSDYQATSFEVSEILHGNAGLGIVLANGAESAIRGIAPACTLKGLYPLKFEAGQQQQHLESGIRLAAKHLVKGDVILLALQMDQTLLPVEVKPGVFKAIRAAASKGIIVIEAAGNQGRPLKDALETPKYAAAWTDRHNDVPTCGDLPDSGAIIVGGCRVLTNGAQYDPPIQDDETRYGSRVDCCAWSRDVWTSHGVASDYDFFIPGTSAAAPAIAGLALILQQCAKERLGRPLTPVEMRGLFRDPTCGTEVTPIDSASPITMPDAMKLFKRLEDIPS